jgi:hypothetical protein
MDNQAFELLTMYLLLAFLAIAVVLPGESS